MNAGPELDALVAVHVMTYRCDGSLFRQKDGYGPFQFRPSRDARDAVAVLERFHAAGRIIHIQGAGVETLDKPWSCQIGWGDGEQHATTLLVAICLAALKAVGVEVPA